MKCPNCTSTSTSSSSNSTIDGSDRNVVVNGGTLDVLVLVPVLEVDDNVVEKVVRRCLVSCERSRR